MPDIVLFYVKLATQTLFVLLVSVLLVRTARGAAKHHSKRRILRNLPGPHRRSFFTGNLLELFDAFSGLSFYSQLSAYGGVSKIHGLCGDVTLVISDPRALAHMLVKDPSNFPSIDIAGSLDAQRWLFGPGLLASNGAPHRLQRKMLNPAFSLTKIRRLAPLVRHISCELRDILVKEVAATDGSPGGQEREGEVDIAQWFGRMSLDLIAQVGFGHTFHALEGDRGAYVCALKEIISVAGAIGPVLKLFILSGAASLPPSLLRIAGNVVSQVYSPLRDLIRIKNTLHSETRAIWDARKAAFKANNRNQNENGVLLNVLLDANGEGGVSEEELCSQTLSLVFGGTETTSTVLSRMMHLFALYPDVQDTLRSELVQAFAPMSTLVSGEVQGDGLDYDMLMSLPYLDAVCKETLRAFSPIPFRPRRSINESILPLADGTDLHVPADTEILVNIHGVNTDRRIWGDDASDWKPGRWLAPLPTSVADAKVPGIYANQLSFFAGPKGCIGLNLALLALKTVLATLIPIFRFRLPVNYEIEWRFAQSIAPSVKGEKGMNSRMPLRMELLAHPGQPVSG